MAACRLRACEVDDMTEQPTDRGPQDMQNFEGRALHRA
jgi:hypothetical protein